MYLYSHERRMWDNMFSSLVGRGKSPDEALATCDAAIKLRRMHRTDLGPAKVLSKWDADGEMRYSGEASVWKEPGSYR